MNKHWSQIQESGVLLGMRFMLFIYRYLGRGMFTIFLYPVIAYYFLTKKQARNASIHFLKKIRAQGGISSAAHLPYWSFKHFLHFGDGLLDKLAVWVSDIGEHDIEFEQLDDFLRTVEKGSGALIISSHLGNQEICRALANKNNNIKLNILVHTKHAEKFNQLLGETNKNNHLNLLQVTDVSPATAIMLQDKLNAGEVVVIAGDRTPQHGERMCTASFLGEPAYFPQGPYILASVLCCPVYLLFSVKDKKGYRIFFEHFADTISLNRKNREAELSQRVQQFADRLAHYTLRFPLQWNNFYDFWASASKHTDKK